MEQLERIAGDPRIREAIHRGDMAPLDKALSEAHGVRYNAKSVMRVLLPLTAEFHGERNQQPLYHVAGLLTAHAALRKVPEEHRTVLKAVLPGHGHMEAGEDTAKLLAHFGSNDAAQEGLAQFSEALTRMHGRISKGFDLASKGSGGSPKELIHDAKGAHVNGVAASLGYMQLLMARLKGQPRTKG